MLTYPSFFNGVAAPYQIEQSLRFAGETNQYLYRTGAITAQGGVSLWVKFHRDFGSYTSAVADPIIYLSGGGPWIYRNGYGYLYYRSINTGGDSTWSGQRCRDHSAWYHIFLKFNSSNSTSLYVNNVLWGTQSTNIGTSSGDQRIGYDGAYYGRFNLAEYHAAFGESLDATDFGEYDDNGVWVPKEFTGNYGSQGFYLKFDPSAANGLGHDHSGNGNHFTDAGGFTTSGTGTDVMSDTPTTNWCTLNPLAVSSSLPTLSDGNLQGVTPASGVGNIYATMQIPSSGKWYWEVKAVSSTFSAIIGVSAYNGNLVRIWESGNNALYYNYVGNGQKFVDGVTSNYGVSYTSNDLIGVACDVDAGTIEFFVNGTSQGSISHPLVDTFPAACDGTNTAGTAFTFNFGQRAFEQTPPTGYKALNTANLPAPTVKDGSKNFNTVLYTGNGATTQTITGVGFDPDFTWIKNRSSSLAHNVYDVVRGDGKKLKTNAAEAESDVGTDFTFETDGFFVGNRTETNESGSGIVAWNWLAGGSGSSNTAGSITSTVSANPTAGFSIVTYTGTGANATVGHGLGVAPKMVIIKRRDVNSNWAVYHDGFGPTKVALLDDPIAPVSQGSTYWQNTAPSDTVVTLGTTTVVNGLNGTYVAYCWHSVPGYSSIGSYVGNGSVDGPFVYTGFRTRFLLYKNTASTSDWYIIDTARNSYNPCQTMLYPNLSNAEYTYSGTDAIDVTANGFKIRYANTGMNTAGVTYIYMAFAEHPMGGSGVSPATAR